MADHYIHTPADGRGSRRVFLNGKPVKNVVYADTLRGIVRYQDDPPQVGPDGVTYREHEARGRVCVEKIHDHG